MCSYLQRAPHGVYYFRMGIPAKLRPFMGGKREIKVSLGLKDRDAAKAAIPDHTKAALGLLAQAKRDMAAANAPAPAPKSTAQLDRERAQADYQEWQAELVSADLYAQDIELEALEPIMDALAAGREPEGSPAEIARAGKLLIQHERELAEIDKQAALSRMYARYSGNPTAIAEGDEPVPNGPGKGVYLDTDILPGWIAERKPGPSAVDMYRRDATLFYSLMGRKSAELITKTDVQAYKRKLIDDPKRSQVNVRDRLANLRTLLEWAAQNDVISDNPARDVRMLKSEPTEKREDWSVVELNALLAGPVHAKREIPKSLMAGGEAAYWLPLLAIFTGARREELGQLLVPDVRLEQYYDDDEKQQEAWCINITDNEEAGNRVKNAGSRRLVPLHPKLIELGFIDFVQSLPDRNGQVFPLLKRVGSKQRLTDKFGQWFTSYRRSIGIPDSKVFHGLRHTWKTQAVDAGIPERICRQFQGHEGKDVADNYGKKASMTLMVSSIALLRFPGLRFPS